MAKIKIRYQRISDAAALFSIFTNPHFKYLIIKIASVKAEEKWLSQNASRRRRRESFNYSIILDKQVVGGIGIHINKRRPFIGEIGYFIDEKYWGQGLASQAVKLIEREGFKKIGLRRIEILMRPENKASERVAIKNNYKKEGLMRRAVKGRNGRYHDVWLYAKTR